MAKKKPSLGMRSGSKTASKAKRPTAKKKSKNKPARKSAASASSSSAVASQATARRKKLLADLHRQDAELVKQLNERARMVVRLAAIDADEPSAASDAQRIDVLAERSQGPLSEDAIRGTFRELFSGCRRLTRSTRVSYLGPESSYSYLAARERFGESAELIPVGSVAAAFEEVAGDNADFAVVPLENSTDGRIVDTFHMFAKASLRVCGEVRLRIHHQLLGKGPRAAVKKIYSKPQALSQCRVWLNEHYPDAECVATSSTTAAAEMAGKDARIAAIASRQAGARYGLKVLAVGIEDNPDNVTRFAILGHESGKRTGNDRTALYFQVAHSAGALADVLMVFKRSRLNMTWIESFPLPGKPSEYFFFAEVDGHEADLKVRKALMALEKKTHLIKVLGSYATTQAIGQQPQADGS